MDPVRPVAPWISLLVVAVVAFLAVRDGDRTRDALQQERALRARADSLLASAEAREPAYARDTVVLWRTKRVVDTLTETVDQWKYDTTKVTEYVYLADSTIRACVSALQTCELQKQELRGAVSSLQQAAAEHAATHPSRLKALTWDVAKVLIGFGLGSIR